MMKTIFLHFLSVISLSSCFAMNDPYDAAIHIIPEPVSVKVEQGYFHLNEWTTVISTNEQTSDVANMMATLLNTPSGYHLAVNKVKNGKQKNVIILKINNNTNNQLGNEGYTMQVTQNRILIVANKPNGLFYGMQTLMQLLPPDIESKIAVKSIKWEIPCVNILDYPRFGWRGLMLDVSRHFFPKEDVLKMIDYLSVHKINTLHLHLVDDQGWRIEIKKYPKLTQVGAWRVDRENKPWNSRSKQQIGEKATYGGYYTQNDIREMVAYAKSRYVNIIPEIEMPAHVSSALAAYPQFSCNGDPFTVPPGAHWPITDIYCAGKDSTFLFLQDVLTEVMDLFPSKYIHVGGDEATKTNWDNCPDCKKRIKAEGLKNVEELQSYFIKRIEKFINSKGKKLLGWEEILEGGIPPEATIMSWRGFKAGIEAANQGHDVVMTPRYDCYFDYYQGPKSQETMAAGSYLPLCKVYKFNPVPEELSTEAAKHILGGQANLWTELVPNMKQAEYMTFPRIAALAEALWSSKEAKNWESFSHRIQLFMKRYNLMGINFSKSCYKVMTKTKFDTNKKQLAVSLTSELAGVEIHYTTDGSEPSNLSPIYSESVLINKTATLKAVTIVNGQPAVKPMSQSFNFNKATGKSVKYMNPYNEKYKGSGEYTLVNGVRGSTDDTDGEWQAWGGTDMEVVIDLQQPTNIHRISVGSLQNIDAWIFFPKKLEFFFSNDGINFQKGAETVNLVDPLSGEVQIKDFSVSFNPVSVTFIKLIAKNLGKCPVGHEGEGKAARMLIDEIIVE